jgi:hypothetical protein
MDEILLDPETLYIVENRDGSVSYGRTPDGLGMYWYDEDQKHEAQTDVCDYKRSRYFDSPREFDDFRYGPI